MSDEAPPRLVSALALALLVVASGCASSGLDPSTPEPAPNTTPSAGTPSETPTVVPGPLRPPEKPANLSGENVTGFVERTEYVHVYNQLRENMTDVSVRCKSNLTARTEHGFYVVAACAGSASNANTVADYASTPIPYFVNETETVRAGHADHRDRSVFERYAADDPDENVNPPNQSTAGFRVYNFAPRSYSVSVHVTYLNASHSDDVLSTTYEVGPEAGIWQDGVTVRRGTYRIDAELGNGETTTYRWRVDGSSGYSWAETAIYVTPTGNVFVVELPVSEVRP